MRFYATFGYGQQHEHCFVEIVAENRDAAREKMFATYGQQWAFMYDESQKENCIDRYHLTQIDFGE